MNTPEEKSKSETQSRPGLEGSASLGPEPQREKQVKPDQPSGKREFNPPVAWLIGRQLIRSLKGTLLYTAFGKKLDPRDWMQASIFPSKDKAEALHYWRKQFEHKNDPAGYEREDSPTTRGQGDEEFWQGEKEFWFDYIADTGDGSRATYNIAYLCLSDLFVQTLDPGQLAAGTSVKMREKGMGPDGYEVLPRGEFLFIGGDTAYHLSDYMTLANRVQLPFQWAYEDLLEDKGISGDGLNRPLFGIPGNHDYYDQLDGFRRQFRQTVRKEPPQGRAAPNDGKNGEPPPQLFIPGFNRKQEASYVALQLPFGWWIWGLDTEVGQIDERQRKFFRDICAKEPADPNNIIPPNKLIVATCAPTTVFGKFADPNDGKAVDAFAQLGLKQPFLPDKDTHALDTTGDARMEEGQCRLDISGDVHLYARYWGPEPVLGARPRAKSRADAPSAESYASVVSGIGGAFHHPSATYVDEVREQVLYPSVTDSTREVARRLLRFWKIWAGGYVWLLGSIIAFAIYFASVVPQSSSQVINNFPPLRILELVPRHQTQISPTTMPLTLDPNDNASIKDRLESAASEPVTPFWNRVWAWISRSPGPVSTWIPPQASELNPQRYFYWPSRVEWTWDLLTGVLLFLLSPIPLVAAMFSKKLFGTAPTTSMGSDVKLSHVEATSKGAQVRAEATDPEIEAKPEKWVWTAVVVSSLMVFLGLLTIKPYRAHITPFGASMIVLFSILWGLAAVGLSIRYSEFLFKKTHRHYIVPIDWALTWVLSILSVTIAALGLWWFARNNRPEFLIGDTIFVIVLIGAFMVLLALPFKAGGELLQPHGRIVSGVGKFLIGLWHAILQIAIPFILIRKGSSITWGITVALIFVPIRIGEFFLRKNSRVGLVLMWVIYGAAMLGLPYIIDRLGSPLPHPFLDEEWAGLRGLLPALLAGVVGAVMSCVWFGWYLAVCFAFNGHNNEVGGAARIEEFKQFIRFRLTEDGLTGYVIGFDDPKMDNTRFELKPKIIDVFRLKAKPAGTTR